MNFIVWYTVIAIVLLFPVYKNRHMDQLKRGFILRFAFVFGAAGWIDAFDNSYPTSWLAIWDQQNLLLIVALLLFGVGLLPIWYAITRYIFRSFRLIFHSLVSLGR